MTGLNEKTENPSTSCENTRSCSTFSSDVRPKYAMLGNPQSSEGTIAKVATLGQVAAIREIELRQLAAELAAEIAAKSGQYQDSGRQTGNGAKQAKTGALKDIVRDLHRGASPESVKARFAELVDGVDCAAEIARMEQQLVAEGVPQEEIERLCRRGCPGFGGTCPEEGGGIPALKTWAPQRRCCPRKNQGSRTAHERDRNTTRRSIGRQGIRGTAGPPRRPIGENSPDRAPLPQEREPALPPCSKHAG